MAETVVRPARPDDVAGIVALGAEVVPATYGPLSPEYATWCLERWWSPGIVADQVAALPHWVADDGGEVVGVTNLGNTDEGPAMWKLYVRPDHHGHGLGSALLHAVEQAADGTALRLEYLDRNEAAAAFYRARGFVESHRTVLDSFPDLTWVWMSKDLP